MPAPVLVAGSVDGIVPVYDPNASWRYISINEVWNGTHGEGRIVPNIGWYVKDPDTNTDYIVLDLDPVTLIPTLDVKRPPGFAYDISESDVLFGVTPGPSNDTFRIYYDKSTYPYTLTVDARCTIPGSQAHSAKIFKGTVTEGPSAIVLSRIYNNSGVYVSDSIALELVASVPGGLPIANIAIKSVPYCSCIEDLNNGEKATLVVYSTTGTVVYKRQFLIEETTFVVKPNAFIRYITGITLLSDFLAPGEPDTLRIPVNMTTDSINLRAIVSYTDGNVTLPVDGTKIRLEGGSAINYSIPGARLPVTLAYYLSPGEFAASGIYSSNDGAIRFPYFVETTNAQNSYTGKIFIYPEWINSSVGYSLRAWMFNLDRLDFFDATAALELSPITGAFSGLLYNLVQRKDIAVDMHNVSPIFNSYNLTQTVDISLFGAPNDTGQTPWLVSHALPEPSYGYELTAKRINPTTYRIDANASNLTEWLNRVYHATNPIKLETETVAPTPTHFIIHRQNSTIAYEGTIDQWDDNIFIPSGIVSYSNLYIRFIKRVGSIDLQLSMAAMVVKPI